MADVDNLEVFKVVCNALGTTAGETLGERVGFAFDFVTREREGPRRGDVNWASAEHYLFARYVTCWTGQAGKPFLNMSIAGYALLKLLFPVLSLLKAGKGSVTPVSLADLDWQLRGSDDGMVDFTFSPMSSRNNLRYPQPPSKVKAVLGTVSAARAAGAAGGAASALSQALRG